jgi:hypothetical protein
MDHPDHLLVTPNQPNVLMPFGGAALKVKTPQKSRPPQSAPVHVMNKYLHIPP